MGIKMLGLARFPEAIAGQLEFVQYVKPSRTITFEDGSSVQTQTTNFVLDTDDPAIAGREIVEFDRAFSLLRYNDSPGQGLGPCGDLVSTVEILDSFLVYLMVRGPNGVRLPLGNGSWYWTAALSRVSGALVLTSGDVGNEDGHRSGDAPADNLMIDVLSNVQDADFLVSQGGSDSMAQFCVDFFN